MISRSLGGPLFSQGPAVVFRWKMDEGWPIEFVTDNVAGLLGHPAERFLSGGLNYAAVLHRDDLERVATELAEHLKDGPDTFGHDDYRVVRADGTIRWIEHFTVLERDAEGHVRHTVGYLVDVTARREAEAELRRIQGDLETQVAERTATLSREVEERRQAEAALERRDAVQRVLNEAMTRLFAADDWTAIIDEMMSAVGAAVAADRVHLFENVTSASGAPISRLRFEWTAPGVEGLMGNPLLHEMPLDGPTVARWAETLGRGGTMSARICDLPEVERPIGEALDVRAILLVPIFVGDVWWGAIGFVDSRAERPWSDTEARALGVLAGALGVAIRRRRDDEALRRSEERLRGAINSLDDRIALYDAEDRLVLCNEAFRRLSPAIIDRALAERWSFEAMLRADVRNGTLLDAVGREEAFVQERLVRHRNPTGPILRHLADGSACLVRESRTPEGGIALAFSDVTDLQRTNDALAAAKSEAEISRVLLQDALESITESFALYDAEGRLVMFNSAYRRLYKHSPELLQPGTRFEHIVRERARLGMVLDVADDAIEDWLEWRIATFYAAAGSTERMFPDGSWWKVSERRTANGGIAQIATDITAIKAREDALRESEDLFRALFENTVVGAATAGLDSRYRLVNRALCDILGYTADELLTKSPLDVTHPDDCEENRRAMEAMVSGKRETAIGEKRYIRKDGAIVWAIVSTSLIRDSEGKPAYTIRHVQDITERKRAEDAARRLQGELAHVTRVRTMGEMATGFAHELNQPLAAIVNYAQGCLRRQRSGAIGVDEFVRVMELVAAQALRAGDIIRRIRHFVQKDETEIVAVDVNAAIREAIGFITSDALHQQVDFVLNLADELPTVEADAVQMQQVILNLARNAIEAIAGAGAPAGRVEIATAAAPGRIEVRVSDSGPGIEAEVAKRIFDPFFTTKSQGAGMGLAICRTIVEATGGRLTLEEAAPGRTTFHILLKATTETPAA